MEEGHNAPESTGLESMNPAARDRLRHYLWLTALQEYDLDLMQHRPAGPLYPMAFPSVGGDGGGG